MNIIKRIMIGNSVSSEKSDFIWNMLGSGIYSAASMILTFLTIRIMGEKVGGIFSIALTISQMLIYIAYFEMRTYQVTDAKNEFTFKEYYNTKIITCLLMAAVSIGYTILKGYASYKAFVILLMCLYRLIDGFADVFESQFHKDGRLDIAGKSLAYRTLFSVSVYFAILLITHNLLIALTGAIIAAIAGLLFCDIFVYKYFGEIKLEWNGKQSIKILKSCFPLFLGVFLWTYILSASRIAVDDVMTSEAQAYYQVLFLPVSVINLFSGFLFRPMLTKLTDFYKEGKYGEFFKVIIKLVLIMAGFTVICMGGAYVVGIPVLEVIVHLNLAEYRGLFTFLIAAGGVNAIAFIWYYVLTIFRCPKVITGGYIAAAVMAYFISPLFVKRHGLNGAGASYFMVVLVLNIIFVTAIIYKYVTLQRKK